MDDRAAAEPEESVESLRYKIEEYERRFRLLDEQMRILERERQKLSAVVHQTDAGFLVMDSAPKVIWANSVFARRFLDSSHPGALLGQPCHRVLCGRDAACEECPAARPFQSAEVAHHELKIEIHGRPRYLYATAMPIKSMTGETDQVIVMVQDVSNLTVLQQSQQALRASEEKFRSIVLNAAAGVVMVNPEGRLLMVNPAYCRFLGYTEAELLERTVMDITHPDDLERTHNAFPQPDGSYPRTVELEKRYIRKDGTIAWAHVSSSWLVDESGRPRNAVALILDVGERKRAEQELRSSEARKGAILVTALDAIISIDHEGRITEFNPAAESLFGYSREEALGSRMAELIIPPSLREAHQKGFHHYLASGESPLMGKHIELTARRKDGTEVPVEIAFNRVPLTGLPAFTGYIRDLTERKRTEAALREREEQLRHSQKMEAVGTLAGGIAHDFNNILTGILGYADLLQIQSNPGDKVHHAAEVIAKGATRAARLTQQLLGFARKGKNQNIPVDLHAVVQEVVTLLTGSLPANVRIRVDLAVDPFWVRGDPVQLGQVILNLGMNAAEAMPNGGDLSIKTRRVDPSEEILRRHPGFEAGSRLLLYVGDTGTGIPASIRGRIFEPFFTTKADGKGSGMGLAMVYGTIQNHGGFIEVDSQLGQGTEFSIYLPEASAKAGADRRLPLGKPIPGTGRILVVDDEETVRGVAREFLKRLGYQVLTASDGLEAVETYRTSAQEIDLVILDMVMPRLGGRECFRALKEINPEVRAVLCTGYGFNVAAQEILDEGMAGFLQKPYQMSQLSEVVASALKS